MGLQRAPAQAERRALVPFQKRLHPAGMVIVTVGEHGEVRRSKVHAECLGVPYQQRAVRTRVKQNAVSSRFHKKAEPMGARHRTRRAVFHQNRQLHALPPRSFWYIIHDTGQKIKDFRCGTAEFLVKSRKNGE